MCQKGFTLVELLIVVIILAILAAIVVPQFASTTDDANIASLDTSLSNMRAAIDLYNQQHGEYPGANTAVDVACTGTSGTGIGGAGATGTQAFIDQMSLYTDANGLSCSIGGTGTAHPFGPYLQKNTLPANPITAINDLEVIATGDLLMTGTAVNLGWKFDINAGKFIANDTTDPDGAGPLLSYDQH